MISVNPAGSGLSLGGIVKSNLSPRLQIQINTTPPKVEVSQPAGILEIDQSPCRASLGLKDVVTFACDNAELGRQAAQECIQKLVADGDRMANIQTHEDAIVNMAAENSIRQAADIVWVYKNPPSIRYQASKPVINVTMGRVDISV